MDVKYVSHVGYYAAMIRTALNAAERACRRKGPQVRDHLPPEQLVLNFLMNLQASTARPLGVLGEHYCHIASLRALHPFCPSDQ